MSRGCSVPSRCLVLIAVLGVRAVTAAEPAAPSAGRTFAAEDVPKLLAAAKSHGDVRRGATVFASAKYACVSCHKVGDAGGRIGPELTTVGACQPPDYIVESVLWPKKKIKEGYAAVGVMLGDGKQVQGYFVREDEQTLTLKDPPTDTTFTIQKSEIEERKDVGTLMPEGLANAMPEQDLTDVLCFLLELGKQDHAEASSLIAQMHKAATFPWELPPLRPELWPNAQHFVNRDRVYDFYAKEARFFLKQPTLPMLLPQYPGLDSGRYGHWGNQSDKTWADDRWSKADLGPVLAGVFRAEKVTVPKGLCVRLGDKGDLGCCFNPETLCYEAVWRGGFLKMSNVRHGFMDGLRPAGKMLERPPGTKPAKPFTYRGYYRHGQRIIFAYDLGGEAWLDAPGVEDGQFVHVAAPAAKHPLAELTKGGPRNWPQTVETKGRLGTNKPYALDTVTVPYENPWHTLLFLADHDFLSDGTALLCSMTGDVYRVEGLDQSLANVRWRRVASGLHQPLGLLVVNDEVLVLGRDQITKLHDLNGDGEYDFYECVTNSYVTSTGGHDFITGLQRDVAGNFYAASGNQGIIRIPPDRRPAETLATGIRNPDGLCVLADGLITTSSAEGDWTPASLLCAFKANTSGELPHFGHRGPKNGKPLTPPMLYFPRGIDNCGGGQAVVTSDRWGPLQNQLLHFSYGAGTHFLVLRDEVDGQLQGAAVQLPGDFDAGAHRGRFHPRDGQLYVTGMGGWGTYTWADGSFQRVRYTGDPVQLPIAYHVHQNGIMLKFTRSLNKRIATDVKQQFAQVWNYRYSAAYGSPEYSTHHPGVAGHDPLKIASAHVLADGRSLFLELPDLQPVNQLHLYLQVDTGDAPEIFATVNKLDKPFTEFPGYQSGNKQIAAHPLLVDVALLANRPPNPHSKSIPKARPLTIQSGSNLTFATKTLQAVPGEPIQLTFSNPDVVPHNWVLLKAGKLQKVGDEANRLIADPAAAARGYVPVSPDVLAYTDLVDPQGKFVIYFQAPEKPGRYPYLCTFPGHWMVMNGELIVEERKATLNQAQ